MKRHTCTDALLTLRNAKRHTCSDASQNPRSVVNNSKWCLKREEPAVVSSLRSIESCARINFVRISLFLESDFYRFIDFAVGRSVGSCARRTPLETSERYPFHCGHADSRILIQRRLVSVVFVCRGKQQPIKPRKELSKRPSGNKWEQKTQTLGFDAGRFPRAAISGLASVCCVLCELCMKLHPGATAAHAAPREFGENTQPLLPPSEPPQIGLRVRPAC